MQPLFLPSLRLLVKRMRRICAGASGLAAV